MVEETAAGREHWARQVANHSGAPLGRTMERSAWRHADVEQLTMIRVGYRTIPGRTQRTVLDMSAPGIQTSSGLSALPFSLGFLFWASKKGKTLNFDGVGKVYLSGADLTIAGTPPSAGEITPLPDTGTIYYVILSFAAGTATWASGTSLPANTDAVECWRIATITVVDSVATVAQHWTGDIHETARY